MIRVGIDIQSTIGSKTGIGYYTFYLAKSLQEISGLQLFYYKKDSASNSDLNTPQRIFWENVLLARKFAKDKLDLIHIPGFAGPRCKTKIKRVTTVHDLIGMIYPENLSLVSKFYWQKWLPACVKVSDFIIADSENTKKDIIRLLHFPPESIKTVYLAVDTKFKPMQKSTEMREVLKKYGIDRRFILHVGTVEPRKNISGLIEGFSRYLRESKEKDTLLVLAGKKGWDYNNCLTKVAGCGLKGKVVFCDYVSDADLPVLYNCCEVFVYPSFYEGFGLPVLEALSCAVPVICSRVSSLPEIAGDAAVFIDPTNVSTITIALKSLLKDAILRAELSEKSIAQSRKFSREKTVSETIAVYKEVLGGGAGPP